MTITSEQFIAAFRHHPAGVAVITADAGEGPVGLTATSVSSVNLDPPVLMFSASERSSSTPTILSARSVVIHLLSADQLEIAKLCSTSGIDRFADTSLWGRLPDGEPYFPTARAWIQGRVVNSMQVGGSTVVAVQAESAGTSVIQDAHIDPWRPLVYHDRSWHVLGDHSRL